jgi:hypothetical protein
MLMTKTRTRRTYLRAEAAWMALELEVGMPWLPKSPLLPYLASKHTLRTCTIIDVTHMNSSNSVKDREHTCIHLHTHTHAQKEETALTDMITPGNNDVGGV